MGYAALYRVVDEDSDKQMCLSDRGSDGSVKQQWARWYAFGSDRTVHELL